MGYGGETGAHGFLHTVFLTVLMRREDVCAGCTGCTGGTGGTGGTCLLGSQLFKSPVKTNDCKQC